MRGIAHSKMCYKSHKQLSNKSCHRRQKAHPCGYDFIFLFFSSHIIFRICHHFKKNCHEYNLASNGQNLLQYRMMRIYILYVLQEVDFL